VREKKTFFPLMTHAAHIAAVGLVLVELFGQVLLRGIVDGEERVLLVAAVLPRVWPLLHRVAPIRLKSGQLSDFQTAPLQSLAQCGPRTCSC
jgi:hypothetical protein